MLRLRSDLEKEIETLCKRTLSTKRQKKIINELFAERGIPVSIASDILTLKCPISTANIYILYHILKKLNAKRISEYFTEKEIKEYENEIITQEKIKFPLRFKVVQICSDQWIGSITAKQLMALSGAQMINYNENAQRVLKRITRGDEEYYRIQLNKTAVAAIKESLELERYIPNTITLNIPESDSDFVYDESSNEIIIKKLKMFDILDGYHRYIALNNLCIEKPEFDAIFELRITNFSDEKARQFIWQEDQKTKMSKVDSNALNRFDTGNLIVSRLKFSDYGHLIKRNSGIIDEPTLSAAINVVFVENKKYSNSEVSSLARQIADGFTKLEFDNPQIFDKILDFRLLYCILICIKCDLITNKAVEDLYKKAVELHIIKTRGLQKSDEKKLEQILKGGV